MILKQTETLGYWVWMTEENEELSPMFLTKTAATKWKELIFKVVKADIEECCGGNCTCNL
jgi:hypothetical protein